MAYRDDREALRQRVEDLTREVDTLRVASGDGGATASRIEELTRDVEAAVARVEADRVLLEQLVTSLADLAKAPDAPAAEAALAPTTAPETAGPRIWPAVTAVGAVVGLFVLLNPSAPSAHVPAHPRSALDDLPGAPSAVDATALLARAAARAPAGSELVAIEARYVSDDGTLNFRSPTYTPSLRVAYEAPDTPAPAPATSAPLGAPIPYRPPPPQTCIAFGGEGWSSCEALPGAYAKLRPPACSFRAVWDAARKAGAPAGAIAQLRYREDSLTGPTWQFEIEHTPYSYAIADPECRVLTPGEQLTRRSHR